MRNSDPNQDWNVPICPKFHYAEHMAVYQRKYRDKGTGEITKCGVFAYDFLFHGQRYRGSTDCTSKTRAKAYEDDLRKRLERGLAGMPVEEPALRVRTVSRVLDDFERHYAVDHAPKS